MDFRGPSDADQMGRQDGSHGRDSQGESRADRRPARPIWPTPPRISTRRRQTLSPQSAKLGPQLGNYPSAEIIEVEVAYNHWAPFRVAWVCMALALLGMALGLGLAAGGRSPGPPWSSSCAGVLAMLVGFGMRMMIGGRAPVTNMYESVVFVAFGTAVMGWCFNSSIANPVCLTAAAADLPRWC